MKDLPCKLHILGSTYTLLMNLLSYKYETLPCQGNKLFTHPSVNYLPYIKLDKGAKWFFKGTFHCFPAESQPHL